MTETNDRNHPGLGKPKGPGQQNEAYFVLSEQEREAGYIRPVRHKYVHNTCGAVTRMSQGIAETYAVNPQQYSHTWCVTCKQHRPVREFIWDDGSGEAVGS